MKRDHIKGAQRYADDVISGKIPTCKWTSLAVKRQIEDLKREYHPVTWPYIFDKKRAAKICNYIELLKHIKGEWAGTHILLETWQQWYLTTLFGWVNKQTGYRRFRISYNEVPRKNAKSTLSAGIGLYMETADGEGGAECYSTATTREQANIVFDTAKAMAEKSEDLRKYYNLIIRERSIIMPSTNSIFTAISSEAKNHDGKNPHFASVDELHAHKNRALFDVIETGMGARRQSLLSIITTAGFNITGICYELHEYLKKILENIIDDESFFGIIYTIDEGDDWSDEISLRKANPNYGVSVKPEYLFNLLTKAKQSPSAAGNFKTKHLNIWLKSDHAWMDMDKWKLCEDTSLKLEDFAGKKCYAGLDLASRTDIAAYVLLFYEEGIFYIFGKYYLPEEVVDEKAHTTYSHYKTWAEKGWFTLTPGEVIDFSYIKEDILKSREKFNLVEVGFDKHQAHQLSQELIDEGIEMVEVAPQVLNFSEPMKEIEAMVRSKQIRHSGDPVMTWMMSNVVCHLDKKDNIYPNKERYENKIDGVVALIMAMARAIFSEETDSVYETRGIISV